MSILEKLKGVKQTPSDKSGKKEVQPVDQRGKRPSKTLHMLKKRKWLFIALGVIIVIAAIFIYRRISTQRAREAMIEEMSRVETVQVTKQNLIESISVTGTIESADSRDVQASASDVEVLEVYYEEGDYVEAGEVIVVLDTTDLELKLTEAQNSQALSEYKETKSIESAQENYDEAVEDGTTEYQNALEAAEDAKEDLQEAENDLSSAASALERQEERLNELKSSGASNEEIAAAQTEYTARHQAYLSAKEVEEQKLEAYENAVEALEEAEKNNNRNISSAADSLEEAQMEHTYSNDSTEQTIENYQDQIASCTVTAPISGVITAMNVAEGDTYLGEGNTLFSIADNENFIVSASVDEYDINSIAKEQTAAVIVEAVIA